MDEKTPKNDSDPRRPGGPGSGGGGPAGGFRFTRGLGVWAILLVLALLLVMLAKSNMNQYETASISEFWAEFDGSNVEKVLIQDVSIVFWKVDAPAAPAADQNRGYRVQWPPSGMEALLAQLRTNPGRKGSLIDHKYQPENNLFFQVFLPLIPWVLILAVIYFVIFRQLRNSAMGGGMLGNFGRSRHRVSTKEHTHVTFEDVAGVEEAKDEVQEIVQFLRNPKKFQRLGGRIPRGILLVGEPGCGKTLLAKAIAGEADVPFFSISGSDFVEMFVGVGASRVRDLFKQAKENSPCIIFLDEIDAVGRRRGSGFNGGGHDEREQTLNAILVEMDGFGTSDQVIVIAATNRRDVLDPALTRPGRFDREVFVSLPDVKGRYEILKVHANKVKMGQHIDLQRLARSTPMFSGADLAAIINEAAIVATLSGKDYVEMDDLEESRDKVRWGRAKKSRVVDEREKEVSAYHEAGHALLQCLLEDADPIHKVTIIPRGPAGGATFSLPERDRMIYGRKYLLAAMKVCYGGRIAEDLIFGEGSSGAAADIQQSTTIARKMVVDWGMSERLGFVHYGGDTFPGMGGGEFSSREYSDRTAELIDTEIRRIIDHSYNESQGLIKENFDLLERIAKALLKYETLDADDIERLLRGEKIDKPTVADLIAAEADKEVPKARPASPLPRRRCPTSVRVPYPSQDDEQRLSLGCSGTVGVRTADIVAFSCSRE